MFQKLPLLALFLVASVTVARADEWSCIGPDSVPRPEAIREIERVYDGTRDFTAQFTQESVFAASDDRRHSSGKLRFAKPGKMDWEYLPPEEQRFLSDGSVFYWYQPDQKQVMIRDFSASFSSDLPVSFLLGLGKLSESFDAEESCLTNLGRLIKFKPKQESDSLQRFSLISDLKTNFPVAAKVIDAGGNETVIVLGQVKTNLGLESSSFKLDIPKGTDIIDERGEKNG